MYQIKQHPEDFIVREISSFETNNSGNYLYFILKKRNRNTLDVIKQLARILHIPEKRIGFAGSKDKHAVTEQIISFYGVRKEKIENIKNIKNIKNIEKVKLENVELKFAGYGNQPVSLGDLRENYFEIVVRNLEQEKIESAVKFGAARSGTAKRHTPAKMLAENYFDEQRFSSSNKEIGKYLVKKEFGRAVRLVNDARCNEYLKKNSNDFIGALKLLPLRLLRMYVNAYQSYLWNEIVGEFLRKNSSISTESSYSLGKLVFVKNPDMFVQQEAPLIGFGSVNCKDNCKDKRIAGIVAQVMDKEELAPADFIIRQIPELTLEGEMRKIMVEVEDFKMLEKGNDWVKISFRLPKGSYATIVVRRIFS